MQAQETLMELLVAKARLKAGYARQPSTTSSTANPPIRQSSSDERRAGSLPETHLRPAEREANSKLERSSKAAGRQPAREVTLEKVLRVMRTLWCPVHLPGRGLRASPSEALPVVSV